MPGNVSMGQGRAHGWEREHLLTVVPHVVTEQPLCGEPLGAVRALKPLLCSAGAGEETERAVRNEIKVQRTAQMRQRGR